MAHPSEDIHGRSHNHATRRSARVTSRQSGASRTPVPAKRLKRGNPGKIVKCEESTAASGVGVSALTAGVTLSDTDDISHKVRVLIDPDPDASSRKSKPRHRVRLVVDASSPSSGSRGVKTYMCDLCGEVCGSRSERRAHVLSTHGEKPYQCPKCPVRCSTAGKLAAHSKFHSGIKPFACKLCPRRYARNCDLRQHMVSHGASVVCEVIASVLHIHREREGEREKEREPCLLVGCLTSQLVYLRDGSAQTILRATTQIEVADQTFYLTQSQYTDQSQC